MEVVKKEDELVDIKIGSELITDEAILEKIVDNIYKVSKYVNVIVTASGAVAEGRKLNSQLDREIQDLQKEITTLKKSNQDSTEQEEKLIINKQSAFSIGNKKVVEAFARKFGETFTSELLVTHQALDGGRRKLNFVKTVKNNIRLGVLCVINENDAISTTEISYGDNDHLAAHNASLFEQEGEFDKVTLCLMTSANGVLATLKSASRNDNKKRRTMKRLNINKLLNFETVEELEALIEHHTWNAEKGISTGGIVSKIIAAIRAKDSGVNTIILNGEHSEDLFEILDIPPTNDEIIDAIDHGQRWTKFVGSALTDKQIKLLEDYIKAHKNIKVQDWDYENATEI